MSVANPGDLSSQVLRLLTRENIWSALQSINPGLLKLLDGTAPADPTNRLYNIGGNLFWNGNLVTTTAGVGTVTSVDLAMPAIFAVSGNPITGAGTIGVSLLDQVANSVFAGPTGGGDATPAFRLLVDADIPDTITIDGSGNVTWASVNKAGSSLADLAVRSASAINSGSLALARIVDTGTLGQALQSTGGGGPAYAALDLSLATAITGLLRGSSFPALTGDLTTPGGSLATTLANSGVVAGSYGSVSTIPLITVDAKGRVTAVSTANLNGSIVPSWLTGAVRGAILVGNAAAVFAVLTPTVVGSMLRFDGTDSLWSTDGSALTNLNATNLASGSVPIARGGTGLASTPTDGQLLIGKTATNNYALATLTGTANQVVVTNGGGAITLSTPQSIATSSTPQFARIGAGAGADPVAALYSFGPHKHRVYDNGTSGGAFALDLSLADEHTIVLGANGAITLNAPVAGTKYLIKLTQDGTGSRTVTWPTIKWTGGAAPTLTTNAGRTDLIWLYYDGTSYFGWSNLNFF